MRLEYTLGRVRQYFVSIHAPREGCDELVNVKYRTGRVSIHAPREGCDTDIFIPDALDYEFQFTHPGRGATQAQDAPKTSRRFQFTHPGRGATPRKVCTGII